MIFKLFVIVLVLATCDAEDVGAGKSKSNRQKRLLFYDEEGNLVKTYKNPNSLDFFHNADKIPFLSSFFSMFRPKSLGIPTIYMIPVSDQVIQQINNDPMYQNKLLTMPRKELVVEPNALCAGKRTQITAKSCRNFLNCWDGWAFEQECPEGLLFAKEGYCDYPHNVDCSTRTSNEPPPAPTSPQCAKDFEAFRSEQNCNEFFICVDRSPVKFRCPADLAYNQELGVCDYAYNVNCGSSIISMGEVVQSANPQPPQAPPASIIQPIVHIPPGHSPSCSQTSAANPQSSAPTPQLPAGPVQGSGESNVPGLSEAKTVVTTNSGFSSQSWSSSHVAISRQDAIRQLRHSTTS